jgi:pyruvate dehydrogenase E1 component alpha subunit
MTRATTTTDERTASGLDRIAAYRLMFLARRFEERLGDIFAAGKLAGWFHSCIGHEATGAAISQCLTERDSIVPYHRSRVSVLGKGLPPEALAAEIMGRVTSPGGGRGGEAHVMSAKYRIFGTGGVLGAGIPIAAGLGYAARCRGTDEVVVGGFGEGTSNRGAFHEGLNMAAIWKLPVLFVCENNLYAEFSPISEQMVLENVADRAVAYGMPGVIVDGNDPEAVHEVVAAAIARARKGEGPTLIEAKTYRQHGHYEGDPQAYREKAEMDSWRERDPVLGYRSRLLGDGIKSEEIERIEEAADDEVAAAMEAALEQPLPEAEDVLGGVYAEGDKEAAR